MQIYKNLGGNSNIRAYSIGEDFIDVQFNGGALYRYSYLSAGREKVEQMKRLAIQGVGLNSFLAYRIIKEFKPTP